MVDTDRCTVRPNVQFRAKGVLRSEALVPTFPVTALIKTYGEDGGIVVYSDPIDGVLSAENKRTR